jgi:TolA-binding protein
MLMHSSKRILIATPLLLAACASNPDKLTLAELRAVEPDLTEVQVDNGLEEAMIGYRAFLEETPESSLTPEAMRRLADLRLEKVYGIHGEEEAMPVPAARSMGAVGPANPSAAPAPSGESQEAFERRASDETLGSLRGDPGLALPHGQVADTTGPLEAIALYDEILATYPSYEHNDRVLYQKARAFDELGRPDEAVAVIDELVATYPGSRHIDEVEFRRAEYFFTRRRYLEAEDSYGAVVRLGPASEFYELALYKLGWTYYKQELHEEALQQYVALLDYRVATDFDFDGAEDQEAGRRVEDVFRVISLSFSIIGGPQAVTNYFALHGERPYEDRIYRHLGEFYFQKLRYQDAASSYDTFVGLHPRHRSAPHFGIRVVEIFEAGGFPQLVLASKKDFARRYSLESEYWLHQDIEKASEVVAYLKGNLRDLANHYHAVFQDPEQAEVARESFGEAERWYRAFLASFAHDEEAPAIHYQLADLLLEHGDFSLAADEYEHTAYEYPAHERAADAGYAAIFAHRQHQERVSDEALEAVRRAAVVTTLRFVDAFPEHEHAPTVLRAAVEDLYTMKSYAEAIATGERLIGSYPDAGSEVLRPAWLAVAHSAFETQGYPHAEGAYSRVLELMEDEDESRQAVVDNLAASIYQQGEQASEAEDHRAAADHFLRVAEAAPGSAIRATAEYDAGASLILLEDWDAAVGVLNAFREAHPEHELHEKATRQLASVYEKQGDLVASAGEYERIAEDTDAVEVRKEALLVAGDLYERARAADRAIAVYEGYVERHPAPLETAVETRFKLAGLYEDRGEVEAGQGQLRAIVTADQHAGAERTDRIRYLAARSALTLSEELYERFAEVALVQPFDESLAEKRKRMNSALSGFGGLVSYEVGEVTAAATYYMAEIYGGLSTALLESERPSDLGQGQLQDYELVLEEEAYPFEEKAIEVHRKNLELMDAGVYNRWIEKSLAKLAVSMPGRYAKFEASPGPLLSVAQYQYTSPAALLAAARLEAEEKGAAKMDDPAQPLLEPIAPESHPGGDVPAAPADTPGSGSESPPESGVDVVRR